MKILVTGATGFVGEELMPKLEKHHDVLIFSRRQNDRFRTKVGDISNYSSVLDAVEGVDAVIHMAVESSHSASWEQHFNTTVKGTKNIIKASLKSNVKKIVYISSMAVKSKIQINYVVAKRLAENFVKKQFSKIKISVLRPSSIYDLKRINNIGKFGGFILPKVTTMFRPIYRTTFVESILSALEKGDSKVYQVGDKGDVKLIDFVSACAYPRRPVKIPRPLIAPFYLSKRLRFLLEDKQFENNLGELGVVSSFTFKNIFKSRFPDSWEGKLKKFLKK